MDKKVIDILPPKKAEKERQVNPEIKEKELPPRLKTFAIHPPSPPLKKGLLFSLLFFLILGGIFSYFILPKAEIEIWPEAEPSVLETKLIIDKTIKKPDFSAKIIPAEVFQKEKTIAEVFSASGKLLKEKKAEGVVKVYNAYSVLPQILVATTRFVSSDGKVFRTPMRVAVPGGRYERGKLLAGEIDIKVEADQPGPEYNIDSSAFSIPGFAGTEKYTKIYAKSFQPMTGGLKEEAVKVTKGDLIRAEDSLIKKAAEECEDLLRSELQSEAISSDFNYLKDNIRTEIVEKFSLASAEEELKEFKFQVKSKCETLLFKKETLERFAEESILSQIPEGKKLYEKSLKIDYYPETINLEAGKIIFSLKASAKIYSDVDVYSFKNALKEKSLSESKMFLENQPKVAKTNVKLWPFWARKIPDNPDKIIFKIIVD